MEPFQLGTALERVDGDKAFLFSLIEEFFKTVDQEILDLKQALTLNDRAKFKADLHRLKGTAGNLGAYEVFSFIAETESNLSKNPESNLENVISELLHKIDAFKMAYQSVKV